MLVDSMPFYSSMPVPTWLWSFAASDSPSVECEGKEWEAASHHGAALMSPEISDDIILFSRGGVCCALWSELSLSTTGRWTAQACCRSSSRRLRLLPGSSWPPSSPILGWPRGPLSKPPYPGQGHELQRHVVTGWFHTFTVHTSHMALHLVSRHVIQWHVPITVQCTLSTSATHPPSACTVPHAPGQGQVH